jgi:RNA polymerase sigma factor (sigma-70 family)
VSVQPFESVVAEHGEVVLRVCRALLGPVDADDAWSATFLDAMRAYPRLAPESNVRGWLVTIAHRRSLDRLRSSAKAAIPFETVPERPSRHDIPEPVDHIHAALAELTPKQRQAVAYHYLADLPYADVARLLDCTEAAARRSAADGIARLRLTLGTDDHAF